jgi:AbiV family abortive infection protein
MDLGAVKAASRPDLLACVAAAAENTQGLLNDAELLSAAGQHARAYSLAVLAVEEFGKATSLMALAAMPKNLRAQAPVRRMLEWHQLKLVGGMLMAVVTLCPPGGAARLAAMPMAQLEQILDTTDRFAEDSDRLKLRGFYVDMDRDGRIRRPSEITETEVSAQLGRARQAASSACLLRDKTAWLRDPPPEAIELSRAMVQALAEAGDIRSPEAAAAIVLQAVTKLQQQLAASDKAARSRS